MGFLTRMVLKLWSFSVASSPYYRVMEATVAIKEEEITTTAFVGD